jgi:hypothetical protein
VVLEVLAEVVRRTEGRVTTLTKAQADLIPIFHAAFEDWLRKLPPAGRAWQAYVWSRFYLSWVRSEQDELDFAVFLASVRSKGRWPLSSRFRQIDRVNTAATGWLPEEFRRTSMSSGGSVRHSATTAYGNRGSARTAGSGLSTARQSGRLRSGSARP